jgi:hypothetical protein
MDIRNVTSNGSVERSSNNRRGERGPGDAPEVVLQPVARDEARISPAARSIAATIGNLAERARNAGGDRSERLEAARQKLAAGELDQPAALASAARRLRDSGFASA